MSMHEPGYWTADRFAELENGGDQSDFVEALFDANDAFLQQILDSKYGKQEAGFGNVC